MLSIKPAQFLHRFHDVIFENFRVRMTSFYLTKLYPRSNFDHLYLRQYRSYKQTSKHRCTSFWPEKGFWTSSGCHRYFFNDPLVIWTQMYSSKYYRFQIIWDKRLSPESFRKDSEGFRRAKRLTVYRAESKNKWKPDIFRNTLMFLLQTHSVR